MSSVLAETTVNLTLSVYYKCMHARGKFFLIGISGQIKYQKSGIIHTFVHRFLLQKGRSVVKLKHWYFLLVSRDFHYESILAVVMPDRNKNSVFGDDSIVTESKFSKAV